jgi:hypothetical protein
VLKHLWRNVAILIVGLTLATWTSVALGAIDARKLLVLWAIFSGLLYFLVSRVRGRPPRTER